MIGALSPSLLLSLVPVIVAGACSSLGGPSLEDADWTIAGASFFREGRPESPAPTAVGGVQRFSLRDRDGAPVAGPFAVRSTHGLFVPVDDRLGRDVALQAVAEGVDLIVVENDTHTASFELEAREATGIFAIPNMSLRYEFGDDVVVFAGGAWLAAYPVGAGGESLVDETLELLVNGAAKGNGSGTEWWDVSPVGFVVGENTISAVGYEDLSTTITGVDKVDAIEAVDAVEQLVLGEQAYLTFRAHSAGRQVLSVPWDVSGSEELTVLGRDTGLCPCEDDDALIEGTNAGEGVLTVRVGEVAQTFDITVVEP